MRIKTLVLPMAILFTMTSFNIANAADTNKNAQTQIKNNIEKQNTIKHPSKCPLGEAFKGNHADFGPPLSPDMQFKKPSKEEMAAKKAEFEKRLKLTDKQKKEIELKKQQDREKMKPIFDDIKAKKQEFKTILEDNSLSTAEKEKKIKEVKDNLKELKGQADSLRKENMDSFESILTDKQKKEFEKIKQEQKKEMEQRKKDYEKIGQEQKKELEQRKKEFEKIIPQKGKKE